MVRPKHGIWIAVVLALALFPHSPPIARASDQDTHGEAKDSCPPIDCPLHKAGIDPTKLKAVEEVEKYIAFLERPDRAKWQKPDDVVKALGLGGSETVVDLGAGSGYFTFRFTKALPRGKVIASDTQPEMIRHIHQKAMSDGISNIEPRIAKPEDPGVSKNADLVFVCDVLHHIPNRAEWLMKLHAQMPSGARLAVIEFKSGKLPEGPPESIKIPKDDLIALVKKVGFTFKEDRANLLPYQEFLVFVKP
ncbi:MAG: class I SAM-dependent methyltransferase [Thermoguttaceae bacterium]